MKCTFENCNESKKEQPPLNFFFHYEKVYCYNHLLDLVNTPVCSKHNIYCDNEGDGIFQCKECLRENFETFIPQKYLSSQLENEIKQEVRE